MFDSKICKIINPFLTLFHSFIIIFFVLDLYYPVFKINWEKRKEKPKYLIIYINCWFIRNEINFKLLYRITLNFLTLHPINNYDR